MPLGTLIDRLFGGSAHCGILTQRNRPPEESATRTRQQIQMPISSDFSACQPSRQ